MVLSKMLRSHCVRFVLPYLFVLCLPGYISLGYSQQVFNPHEHIQSLLSGDAKVNSVQCLSCHKKAPLSTPLKSGKHVIPEMSSFVKSETMLCATCHGDDNSSHIVGITPEYSVPADLPLNENGQVTCITCHYVHGDLKSDKPMASTSFMDQLFNRQRLSKSYVLRRNNSEGDLCLACHSKKE